MFPSFGLVSPSFGLSFSSSTNLLDVSLGLSSCVSLEFYSIVLSSGWLQYSCGVALKGLSGSRLSNGSSGRPVTKALIEKDASYSEKAKFRYLVFAMCVEARLQSLLCGKSFGEF